MREREVCNDNDEAVEYSFLTASCLIVNIKTESAYSTIHFSMFLSLLLKITPTLNRRRVSASKGRA